MKKLPLAFALILATSGLAAAQNSGSTAATPAMVPAVDIRTLVAGDLAPALTIAKWVKGQPVTGFEAGRTYVVEFWATWCGPCIASMPHLSELQTALSSQGLTIIGVSAQDPNNTLADVEKMVAAKGEGMAYTVAWDDNRATSDAFMKAAKERRIPTSFVVDKAGRIAYIGHPMFLDLVLSEVIQGTWDVKAGGDLIARAQKDLSSVHRQMQNEPKEAIPAIDAFELTYPRLAHLTSDLKYNAQLQAGDPAAHQTGQRLLDKHTKAKNAEGLNELAWAIVGPQSTLKNKDVDFALKAAEAAAELTGHADAAILDTLARCWFVKGDRAKAIELQEKAVANAKGALKPEIDLGPNFPQLRE